MQIIDEQAWMGVRRWVWEGAFAEMGKNGVHRRGTKNQKGKKGLTDRGLQIWEGKS